MITGWVGGVVAGVKIIIAMTLNINNVRVHRHNLPPKTKPPSPKSCHIWLSSHISLSIHMLGISRWRFLRPKNLYFLRFVMPPTE
jgi:hypothetical protein